MGYDVEFINFKSSRVIWLDIRSCFSKDIKTTIKRFCQLRFLRRNNMELKESNKVADAQGISKADYDSIILGSDEIFNMKHPCFDKVYMGVGITDKHIISYAVSCGQNYDIDMPDDCKKSLRFANSLSVRDFYTQKFIEKNIKITPQIVLDPTMLLDNDCNTGARLVEEDYLLLYSFTPLKDIREKIIRYAKERGLKIVLIGTPIKDDSWVDNALYFLSLDEWKRMFYYSTAVITDSYHGTIFAIKNHKQFMLIKKNDKENKIKGLLNQIGLEKSFYNPLCDIKDFLAEPIDYEEIDNRISILRKSSIDYLKASL